MKAYKTIIFCLLVIFAFPAYLHAQLNFNIQKIDLPKPFSHAFVKFFQRDQRGFFYFTTNQGIWRFDGTDVQPFNIPGVTLPVGSLIHNIYCYKQFIFFIYRNDKELLYCYDNIKLKLYKYKISEIYRFEISPKKSELFIFARDGKTYRFNEQTLLRFSFDLNRVAGWKRSFLPDHYAFDKSGQLYFFFRTNVGTINNGKICFGKGDSVLVSGKYENRPTYDRNSLFIRTAFATSKYLVAEYPTGFVIYDKTTLNRIFDYQSENYVYTVRSDDHISIILKTVKPTEKPPSSSFFTTYQDAYPYADIQRAWGFNDGSGYAAFTQNHLFLLSPSKRNQVDTASRNSMVRFFSKKSIRGIYNDGGNYYVGTYSGTFIVNKQGYKKIPIYTYTIEHCADSTLLIGVDGGGGFATLNTQTGTLKFLPNPGQHNLSVTKLLKYKDKFIGAMRGTLYWVFKNDQGEWVHTAWIRDSYLGVIKDLALVDGELWMVGEAGLFKIEGNRFRKIEIKGLGDIPIYAILKTSDGIYLATLGRGIIKINGNGKLLNEIRFANGLAGDFVYSLCEVDGLLFAGTNGGVSVFDIKRDMQALPYPDDNQFDELYTQEFNHAAIYYDKQNRQVIMGGLQGLIYLSVDYYKSMRDSRSERLILSYIKKSSNSVSDPQANLFAASQSNFTFRPDEKIIAFKFSGSYKQKEFLFRIKEISNNWQKNKLAEEISLYSLPPGKYTLQARFPTNTDRRYWYSETITILPAFYQTWAFKTIVILLCLFLAYQFWLSRLKRLKNEMELRTSIASELHDEIGSTLTRISLRSELMHVKQELDNDIIQKISDDSKSAIASISDIIWSVDARNDTKEDMISRMQEHVHSMLSEAAEVKFETRGLEKTGLMPQLTRQNIYLIFKEAINNIVKHNHRPYVLIKLDNQPKMMVITIKNSIDRKASPAHPGQGLRNMQMRAKRIKANLNIKKTDKEFLITLRMKRW